MKTPLHLKIIKYIIRHSNKNWKRHIDSIDFEKNRDEIEKDFALIQEIEKLINNFPKTKVVEQKQSNEHCIAIHWYVDDVISVDKTLTQQQAANVLAYAKRHHDATIGINWEVLEAHIDYLKNQGKLD